MKPKGNSSKWASFVAPDATNNTPWTATELINKALAAAGLNVTRVSIIQATNTMGGDEEVNSHEFLADKTFPKEAPLNYYGDFQEPFYRQFNYGDLLDWLRNNVVEQDPKYLPAAVIPWLVQAFANVYDSGNQVGPPGSMGQYPVINPYQAILISNEDAQKAVIARVLPLLQGALEADGGL